MTTIIKEWLQFFADGASGGAAGGDGAATGVTSADAGQSTGVTAADAGRSLEDLGVPSDRAERYRQRKAKRGKETGDAAAAENTSSGPAGHLPLEGKAGESEAQANPATDWDAFMEIPENKQRLQVMIAERGKQATAARQQAEAQLGKIAPMLELIASRYGLEAKDGQYDLDALTKAVTDDDSYYERRAEDLGVDIAVAKQLEQSNMERRRAEAQAQALKAQQQKQEREFQLQQHFRKMQQQAGELKKLFPDFDLQRELQNPRFMQLTSPEVGMSVDDAFYSLHHNEIMEKQAEAIARRAKADAAAAIRSGVRPRENGGSAMAAVSSTPDLKHMTREQRAAYIKAKYPPPG